ncbi:MAG: hypothetical protein KJ970_18190, partial [Candidatus Eisenbacteria bacterium]|nr:hypothetical protein [Candidatus Eisenbacteria bacterium]MBU2692853.1 hypothetical protein [Candidatus Eisenbacteria bacterium]
MQAPPVGFGGEVCLGRSIGGRITQGDRCHSGGCREGAGQSKRTLEMLLRNPDPVLPGSGFLLDINGRGAAVEAA